MDTRIAVSLPVKNVPKAVEFFRKLGFTFDAHLTDEKAACMIMDDGILVTLVAEDDPTAPPPRRIYDSAWSPKAQLSIS